EKINLLLTDIKSLEELVTSIRQAEIYPVSFFSKSFDLSQKILHQLHTLEEEQLEMLREQLKEHQGIINKIKDAEKALVVTESPVSELIQTDDFSPVQTLPEKHTPVFSETNTPKDKIFSEEKDKKEQPVPEEITGEDNHTAEVAEHPVQEKTTISLIEILEKKNLSDFRKAFSLNDRFRFRRELFKGDEALMNKVISELNNIDSLELSLEYLTGQFNWNQEEESVSDFIKLLEKRFL
ncbi:MAG: hypothetical protein LIO97_12615, partial [Tannerellaceae bacterium]|nr:hypothetical protein [Tannerellaceae bacterium]